jgi:hypothetical protein
LSRKLKVAPTLIRCGIGPARIHGEALSAKTPLRLPSGLA